MELTVKITPRVAAQVARRLRLAASVRSRSTPAMASNALDEALPSLEEIRRQLALYHRILGVEVLTHEGLDQLVLGREVIDEVARAQIERARDLAHSHLAWAPLVEESQRQIKDAAASVLHA